jgi:hypothetical protein
LLRGSLEMRQMLQLKEANDYALKTVDIMQRQLEIKRQEKKLSSSFLL